MRIPNVFTAIADVSMGYLLADGGAQRPLVWLLLVLVSATIYSAGMVLNDVFDYQIDSRQRPDRPLPSGRVPRRRAAIFGGGMLLAGLLLGVVTGQVSQHAVPLQFGTAPVTVMLVACVLLYDGVLKATIGGPVLMGACRFLNILLGASVSQDPLLFQSAAPVVIAASIGIYVTGIAWLARDETGPSPRPPLFSGLVLMLLGVAILTIMPSRVGFPRARVVFTNDWIWPLLVWLLTAPVWRRTIQALVSTSPTDVQAAVKQALLALIVLDAAIALVVAGPAYALGLLALMIPAGLLARFVYVT